MVDVPVELVVTVGRHPQHRSGSFASCIRANKFRRPSKSQWCRASGSPNDFSNLNPTPEEDIPEEERTVDGSETTNIIVNPSLVYGGSSLDGHELNDFDHRETVRNHLKKRLQARRYMQASQDLKDREVDNDVDDEDLENCGIEPAASIARVLDLDVEEVRKALSARVRRVKKVEVAPGFETTVLIGNVPIRW
jgi:hypothetical protein